MPKEIINNRYLVPNQLTGEGPQPGEITHLNVGWNRTGSVQVAVLVGQPEGSRVLPENCYVDLDRDGINRLIRALRKARKQAYSSDA